MTLPRWQCLECGYHYDPVKGDPKGGIPPGIPFEDLPDSWRCPECGGIEGKARSLRPAITIQSKSGNCRALFDTPHLQILPMQKKNIRLGHLLPNNPPVQERWTRIAHEC